MSDKIESMLQSLSGRPKPKKQEAPSVLQSRDIPGLAKYMKSKQCRNVFFMLGAGVSTSAGIPDFRSPETGLYANLARLNLPYPEAVFSIQFFRSNPAPFYALAKELYPGKYRPTPSHSFVKLLSDKALLHTCFTQNIDTLERRAGVPDGKVIEAHGSFASHKCIDCQAPYGEDEMKRHVDAGSIPRCAGCGGLVKPDIVFFGESLPEAFFGAARELRDADLLIVMGTSLVVHPFAALVDRVPDRCPRVLINMEAAGGIGRLRNDVVLLGKCDEIVQELADELGWGEELRAAWAATADAVETGGAGRPAGQEFPAAAEPAEETSKDALESEVEKLVDAVNSTLNITDEAVKPEFPATDASAVDAPKTELHGEEAKPAHEKTNSDATASPAVEAVQTPDTKL